MFIYQQLKMKDHIDKNREQKLDDRHSMTQSSPRSQITDILYTKQQTQHKPIK